MAIVNCLGSFPNSRIRARKATQVAQTAQILVALGPINTLIAAPNTSRTYLTLRNTSLVDSMAYGYVDVPTLNVDGFLLGPGDGIDLETLGSIWGVSVGANPCLACTDEGQG